MTFLPCGFFSPLAPELEAPGDRVKQPGFVRGWFLNGRPPEETRAQLGIVRQHAGVGEQLLSIDGGSGYVLKTQDEELQRLPMIGREQFP